GRGVCQVSGRCRCFSGWSGTDCSTAEPEGNKGCNGQQRRLCEGRGRFVDGRCQCFDGYSGDNCETESCTVLCQHGRCPERPVQLRPRLVGRPLQPSSLRPVVRGWRTRRLRQRHLPLRQRLEWSRMLHW
uniref:EGF-like domain-containing protein n=1 Tax=Macrostomum lignano TaxID=282301 RepID=A0A1I8IVS8_9PLAT